MFQSRGCGDGGDSGERTRIALARTANLATVVIIPIDIRKQVQFIEVH